MKRVFVLILLLTLITLSSLLGTSQKVQIPKGTTIEQFMIVDEPSSLPIRDCVVLATGITNGIVCDARNPQNPNKYLYLVIPSDVPVKDWDVANLTVGMVLKLDVSNGQFKPVKSCAERLKINIAKYCGVMDYCLPPINQVMPSDCKQESKFVERFSR
jgi:hypothetical protein